MHKIVVSFVIASVIVGSYFHVLFSDLETFVQSQTASVAYVYTPSTNDSRTNEVFADLPRFSKTIETVLESSSVVNEVDASSEKTVVSTEKQIETNPKPIVRGSSVMKRVPNETQSQPKDASVLSAFDTAFIAELHRLTNMERKKAGLTTLKLDSNLADIAYGHSADMVARSFYAHKDPDGCASTCRFKEAGYTALAWGENIMLLKKFSLLEMEELAQYAYESWMQSGGHRANILHEAYTHEGYGIARDGDILYVTVAFALPK